MHFKRRQRIKQVLFSRVAIVLLAALVFLLARGVWGIYEKERDTEYKLEQSQQEAAALGERERFLRDDISRLETVEGVEGEIRENFGLGKAGEGVIIVVPGDNSAAVNANGSGGFWNRIKSFFTRD
ncbi:hypothetical protein L0Y40_02690 [Candidatus Wolfebacteria bacterium]|nr:hypothetical protein [Candidatus Wolfebacteria bacterium]